MPNTSSFARDWQLLKLSRDWKPADRSIEILEGLVGDNDPRIIQKIENIVNNNSPSICQQGNNHLDNHDVNNRIKLCIIIPARTEEKNRPNSTETDNDGDIRGNNEPAPAQKNKDKTCAKNCTNKRDENRQKNTIVPDDPQS